VEPNASEAGASDADKAAADKPAEGDETKAMEVVKKAAEAATSSSSPPPPQAGAAADISVRAIPSCSPRVGRRWVGLGGLGRDGVNCNGCVIEAPWLVHGGHGASLRQPLGSPDMRSAYCRWRSCASDGSVGGVVEGRIHITIMCMRNIIAYNASAVPALRAPTVLTHLPSHHRPERVVSIRRMDGRGGISRTIGDPSCFCGGWRQRPPRPPAWRARRRGCGWPPSL
jgi:hypothetical protein